MMSFQVGMEASLNEYICDLNIDHQLEEQLIACQIYLVKRN